MYSIYNMIMSAVMAINFNFDSLNTDSWKTTLPIMLYGMLGIFIVIGVIVLVTYALNKITAKKKKKDNEINK